MDLRYVWQVLALFPLSCTSLTLVASQEDLIYGLTPKVTTEIFESIEYQDFGTLLNVASLLEGNSTLQRLYDLQHVSEEMAKALVDSVIDHPQLHPNLLSFRLCARMETLVEELRPYLLRYNPRVFRYFDNDAGYMAFSDDDLKVLLENTKPGWNVINLGRARTRVIQLHDSPDMKFDLDSKEFPEAEGIFQFIDRLFRLSAREGILVRALSGNSEFDNALRLFISDPQANGEKLLEMDDILVELMDSKEFCPIRKAFWRLKLTHAFLRRSTMNKYDEVCRSSFSLFQNIATSSNVLDLCPDLLESIMKLLSKKRHDLKPREDFIPKLQEIYTIYPEFSRIYWENYSQRVRRWVDSAQDERLKLCPPIPDDDLSVEEAIAWWGTYSRLTDAVFMPINLRAGVSIQVNGQQKRHHNLLELLETLTSILSSDEAGIFETSSDGLLTLRSKIDNSDITKSNALIRTMMCNMIYRGKPGFELTQKSYDSLVTIFIYISNPFIQYVRNMFVIAEFPFPLFSDLPLPPPLTLDSTETGENSAVILTTGNGL